LLKRLAKFHPYALVYSLTMAAKSSSKESTTVASVALEEMRNHWPEIVEDTLLLTTELIRVSVLWKEG